jgi:hypothetical protein
MHNFISKKIIRTTLNTIKANFCKEIFVYFISINESTLFYM